MEWWQVIYAVFVTDIRNQQHAAAADLRLCSKACM